MRLLGKEREKVILRTKLKDQEVGTNPKWSHGSHRQSLLTGKKKINGVKTKERMRIMKNEKESWKSYNIRL